MFKKYLKILGVAALFLSLHCSVQAQWRSLHISINGLTCSQCSRAVYNALKKVDGVAEVKMDLNSTTADIFFKRNTIPDPESLANAVRKAGYAVGYIDLMYQQNESSSTSKQNILCAERLCVKMLEMPDSEGLYTIRLLGTSLNANSRENALISEIDALEDATPSAPYFYGTLMTIQTAKP